MIQAHWRMLITSLPGRSGTPRMRVWRALKARGAGILRDGVHLLPATAASEQLMQAQAVQVAEAGGSAHVIDFMSNGDAQTESFMGLFERAGDYQQWREEAAALVARLAALDEAEARRQEARLRRDLEAIVAIDYFPGPARAASTNTLADVEAALNARYSPGEPSATDDAIRRRAPAAFQGRRWATRKNIWVDRIACAWLIRRFIDPQAQFLWLAQATDCPPDAVGFDFDGATFSHTGDRVSFEVLLQSFDLHLDPALAKLGALVHYLDIGGVSQPEAAGFVAMLAGAKQDHGGDDELLQVAGQLLDHLYTAYTKESDV
jgi:hypothetical protein